MIYNLKSKIKKNSEIFSLFVIVAIAVISTSYYNYSKQKIYNNYKTILNNIYLKKTLNYTFNNLEPRFKKISHNITIGETFDNILRNYDLKETEIKEIKKNISKKINSVQTKKNKNLEKFFENSNSKAVIVRPDRFILSSCKSVKDFKSYLARNLFFLT